MDDNVNRKILWSANDLRRITGMSHVTIYRLLNRSDVPVVKIGNRKFVNAKLFERWLEQQTITRDNMSFIEVTGGNGDDRLP